MKYRLSARWVSLQVSMSNFERIAELVDRQDFTALFIDELGWDNPGDPRPVRYETNEEKVVRANPIASKRGVVVYHCSALLDRGTVEGLDREVSRRSLERLLIFTEGGRQQWRWPEPRRSGGTRYITHSHMSGAQNPALIQRLAAVKFRIEEESNLTVLAVRERVRAQFNADEITTKFYNEFRENQLVLMDEIGGIDVDEDRSWYSSLLLNRLMFIYFMQRKGFLNEDPHYLRHSLRSIREMRGPNKFYEYYRDFLIPLFHEGLGSDQNEYPDDTIARIIGDVPYINGGIFALHPLEEEYQIHVRDEAFEQIFDFFDRYRWHLDERPTGNPEEINPEVLGFIFEKYVNQKDQGAYYTKEDVTGYMSAMAILPAVIDRISDTTGKSPWHLLKDDPGRYVPEGVLYGMNRQLPPEVTSANASKAGALDGLADSDLGLPGERWRETLSRRRLATGLLEALAAGEVSDSNGAIARNLELQTLVLDWISELNVCDDIASTWSILNGLKILDPTCGSGAFLFAALDILEELYDATLTLAEKRLADGEGDHRIQAIVAEATKGGSREYVLMKRAVLSNLYGVDLMPEATEIARLRLFLTLVARVHDRSEMDPLPDLDMNIRSGNLLVGCSTPEDAARRFESDLLAIERLHAVENQAAQSADFYRRFVEAQANGQSAAAVNALKIDFEEHTARLRDELDLLYSPHDSGVAAHVQWVESHQPFHWFIEFPEVMLEGGFDAVIGNPPYVSKGKVQYTYSGFITDNAPDIYAPCMERAATLVVSGGGYGLIVPIAFQFSDRGHDAARRAVLENLPTCWASTYSRNPSALFSAGLGVRSTIVIGRNSDEDVAVSTTSLRRWWEAARPYLFDTNRYNRITLSGKLQSWPRFGTPEEHSLCVELSASGGTIGEAIRRSGARLGFKKTALYYLSVFIDDPPSWTLDGRRIPQTEIGYLSFLDQEIRDLAFILLAGRLGVWWWGAVGDDFHVTNALLESFPVSPLRLGSLAEELLRLAGALRKEQPRHPLVTKYAGKEMGNYDMSRCRHITDESDQLVLDHFGLSDLWPTVLLADARLAKVTGERPGTRREWPFPL